MNTRTACGYDGNATTRATSPTPSSQSTKPARALLRRFLGMALALSTGNCLAVGETTIVSVSSAGERANSGYGSVGAVLSADGRFVAFASYADNLVPEDTNGMQDIFLHDRQAQRTRRVSVDSLGNQGDSISDRCSMSADGRILVFGSASSNLVPGGSDGSYSLFIHDRMTRETSRLDAEASTFHVSANGRFIVLESGDTHLVPDDTNGVGDIFVHDLKTHATTRVSVGSAGTQGNAYSGSPRISADGRFVIFDSNADNLVAGDTNGRTDVFIHDRQTHQTERVSVDSSGAQAENYGSFARDISTDGHIVAFESSARNLVRGDWNNRADIFVHDLKTHQTTRVSVGSSGQQADRDSTGTTRLSADGRFVAFYSFATNLVEGDTNRAGDVFLHDRKTGETMRVSVSNNGEEGNTHAVLNDLSADGRVIAFASEGNGFVDQDTNAAYDVFVRDRLIDRSATADLAVTQTVSPSPFTASSPITYTVTVTNHGPDAASEVTLVDGPLKATAVASQGTCSAGAPKVCYLGTLAAGADATVTLTLRPRSAGTTRVWNSAQVKAAPVDPNPGNNKTGLHVSITP